MFTTISVLVGIACLAAAIFFRFFVRGANNQPAINRGGFGLLATFGVIGLVLPWAVFYAQPGYMYRVISPTGNTSIVESEGLKWRGFGQLQDFKKVVTLKIGEANGAEFTETLALTDVQFNDSVNADVGGTFRFNLPGGEAFEKIAVDFRTQENLMSSCLLPSTLESLQNSARMISAQEYVTGRGGELQFTIQDQLANGLFMLDQRKVRPTSTHVDPANPTANLGVAETSDGMTYVVEKRLDANGQPIRKGSNIANYKIVVSQATIDSVDPDPTFDEKLQKQREAAAGANLEQQKAREALYRKERLIADGEATKEQMRVERETEQVQATITAETAKKVAQTNQEKAKLEVTIAAEAAKEKARIEVETETLRLQAEKLRAEQLLVGKTAEAEGRQLLFAADNALTVRLDAWVKAQEAAWGALGKHDRLVPEIVIGSSGNGQGGSSALTLMDLIMVNQAKQLGLNLDDLAKAPAPQSK